MKKLQLFALLLALVAAPALADATPTVSFACSDDCGGFLGSGD